MPNDAKLGLVVGVVVVVTIAVVFFRKDATTSPPLAQEAAAASVRTPKTVPVSPANSLNRAIRAEPTAQSETRHHVVQEGETLFSLAEQYYGDKDKAVVIYRANREVLNTPEQLTPGTDLKIPDLPDKQAAPANDDNQ